MDDAASPCNRAFHRRYEHPWGMLPHTLAILFLPCLIREFLADDGVAHAHHFMSNPPLNRCAMGGMLTLLRGETLPGNHVAMTVFPRQASLFDAPFGIVVLWIIGPPLPI
jgi:hypothetical protein